MARPGAARGHSDASAPVPVSPVQRRSLPAAPVLWGQQDQSRGKRPVGPHCTHPLHATQQS